MFIPTDPLVSTEHGIMAGAIVALNQSLVMLNNHIRKKKRNGSLQHEVETLVAPEVQRILILRQANQAGEDALMRRDLSDLKNDVGELGRGQEHVSSQVEGVNRQLEAMRMGIFRLVAEIKPELVKELELGGPVA